MFIPPGQVKQKLESKEGIFLLDVRTTEEFQEWAIPGAVNIPMHTLQENLYRLPRDKKIIAICLHGVRSARCAEFLAGAGYDVQTMQGGMAEWANTFDRVELSKGFIQVRRLGKGCASYIIISNGEAAVIDPSLNTQAYLKMVSDENAKLIQVIDTHQHADHVSGARLLSDETGAALLLNPADDFRFAHEELKDNQEIEIGGLKILVMHTPGHTPGSTSFLVNGHLVTGDTLFCEGIGRPDLQNKAEEFAQQLWETYQRRILPLPSSTKILPAHHSQLATPGFGAPLVKSLSELSEAMSILNAPKEKFLDFMKHNTPPKIQNQMQIIAMNRGDLPLDLDIAAQLEEGPNKCVMKA